MNGDPILCPDDGTLLKFIYNTRMDEKVEKIGICQTCGKAWREPSLGWEIIDESAHD